MFIELPRFHKKHANSIIKDKSWFLSYKALVKPPSHSDKDHKDRTTFLKRDKRREDGTKCRKNTVFKFVLRPYYAPARMSLRLTRPSYVLSRAWSHTHHVLCVFNTFFLRPFRSHYALTARLPRSHCALRDLINSSPRCPRFHSFCRLSWVKYAFKRSLEKA